jgi:hypothetical protein
MALSLLIGFPRLGSPVRMLKAFYSAPKESGNQLFAKSTRNQRNLGLSRRFD